MQSFISYDLTADDIYNKEGDVVGSDEYVLIENLFVAPADRRKGVGRKMLREAIAAIRQEHGRITIKLAVLPFGDEPIEMDDLVAFYESEGFEVCDSEGCSAVFMEM